MVTPLRAKVSGFHFEKGVGLEGAPYSYVAENDAEIPSKSMKGHLYILVEVLNASAGSDSLANQVVALIRKAYQSTHGTITTSLRAALQAANQYLLDFNVKALYEEQRDVGVCCLVLRGEDAFIARAGPCAVFQLRGHHWERFAAATANEEDAPPRTPLGLRREPEIHLAHVLLAAGDIFLLLESEGAQVMGQVRLSGPAEAAATAALRQAAQQVDFSTLLVEITSKGQKATAAATQSAPPPQPASKAAAPASQPASRKSAETAPIPRNAPRERRPASGATTPPPSKAGKARLTRIALIAALITPLIVIGIVFGYNWYTQRQLEKTVQSYLVKVEQNYTTARATSDYQAARAALKLAFSDLNEALKLAPENTQALQLKKEMTLLYDKVRMVTPLYYLADLYHFEAGSQPARLAVNGPQIFVLDKSRSVVSLHTLNAVGDALERGKESTILVKKGDQVGSVVVGNLVDLAWAPADGERTVDSLLILDASGHLLIYDQNEQLSAQQLAGATSLQSPVLVDSFVGARLYVLDAGANQLWRYVPSAQGYDQPADGYFGSDAQVDLRNARDLSIDGDVWVLFSDRISRFQAGKPVAFELRDLDEPFSSPSGLFASLAGGADKGDLYVADSGNGRIVQIKKDGRFIRQFRPAEGSQLGELRDISIDEADSRLYFLAGSTLYLADLPVGP